MHDELVSDVSPMENNIHMDEEELFDEAESLRYYSQTYYERLAERLTREAQEAEQAENMRLWLLQTEDDETMYDGINDVDSEPKRESMRQMGRREKFLHETSRDSRVYRNRCTQPKFDRAEKSDARRAKTRMSRKAKSEFERNLHEDAVFQIMDKAEFLEMRDIQRSLERRTAEEEFPGIERLMKERADKDFSDIVDAESAPKFEARRETIDLYYSRRDARCSCYNGDRSWKQYRKSPFRRITYQASIF